MDAAKARACANIALVKYWGKRDVALNLPAVGSISMTLSNLATTTNVTFDESLAGDALILNGEKSPDAALKRVSRILDLVRKLAGIDTFAKIESSNNFPTASGLASSASAFSSLALAATAALGLDLGLDELCQLARRGSGSAPRSLPGGFTEIIPGKAADGSDFSVSRIAAASDWDIRLLVAINDVSRKTVTSSEGMERTRLTSQYYDSWLNSHENDLIKARRAIVKKDFEALGLVTEASCFKMHSVMLSAFPPLLYWNGVTIDTIRKVWSLRESGLVGFVTIDAGPHVNVLCEAENAEELSRELALIEGIERVHIEAPGPGAEVLP